MRDLVLELVGASNAVRVLDDHVLVGIGGADELQDRSPLRDAEGGGDVPLHLCNVGRELRGFGDDRDRYVADGKAVHHVRAGNVRDVAFVLSEDFRFAETSVGGVPVIRTLIDGMQANVVTSLTGIINGTTNYILTRMAKEGLDYRAALKEAQAHHKQAQAELKMAEVEVDRVKRLVEKDIFSPIRLEYAMAEADVANLQVQQARSRLLRAETNFSYTTITAPFEGYVDRIPFKVGSLVTPTSLLTSLTDVSDMFAYFKINEKEYLEYKKIQLSGVDQPEYNNLELILSDQSTYRYKGKVETVEGDFERGTGSIAFRARFANPERLLRHGVSGKIRMLTKMEDVVLVPQQSTFEIQDFTYVYTVAEDGKVSVRSFEPLARHGSYYVTQDLPDQTVIVYAGVQMIKDGMTIEPEMVDPATIREQMETSNEIENTK